MGCVVLKNDCVNINDSVGFYLWEIGKYPILSKEEEQRNHVLYKKIEDTFQGFFGSKVRLNPGKKRGKIVIEYTSNDDLERIMGLLSKEG